LNALGRLFASRRILVSRGFVLAFFLAVLATESAHEGSLVSALLFLLGLVLVGLATVGRLWCSLYISGYKQAQLVTAGPYSVSRNPLYFFSLLGFAGIGLATETLTFAAVMVAATLIAYPAVIRSEEETLRGRFGAAFEEYCARTPRLFPDFSKLMEPEAWTVSPRVFRRSMGEVVWFVWFVGIVELVEALHEYQFVRPLIRLP
jgi:protein-S-isoprenylcysteine O-methyltransferase Ste14